MALPTCVRVFLPALALASVATGVTAEPSNLRIGVGSAVLDINPGPDYLPDTDTKGLAIFAEYPQSNHAASRFILYRIHDDGSDAGNDRQDVTGFATQLMWGWGLAEPGFRVYTGPSWHRDKMLVKRPDGYKTRIMNGWGWHLGLGYQLDAITVDIAGEWRDPDDYRLENQRPEAKAAGINDDTPDVLFYNLMISYRF